MLNRFMLICLLLLVSHAAGAITIEMKVNGLVCAFCAQGITKTLRAQTQTSDVLVSLEHGVVAMTLKPDTDLSDTMLKDALTDAGYTVTAISRTERTLAEIKAELARDESQ